MNTTIKHSTIKGRPLIDIITPYKEGVNKDKRFGISFGENSKSESDIEHYRIKHNVEFPLERIIGDYIKYYGLKQAIKILIGKSIINSENRPVIIL